MRNPPSRSLLHNPGYAPAAFLDFALAALQVRNDRALAQRLALSPSAVSKMRRRLMPIQPRMLIHVHEKAGVPFPEIRQRLGIGADDWL